MPRRKRDVTIPDELVEAKASRAASASKWDKAYPAISQIWLRHWETIIHFAILFPECFNF
jgi:transposase-like protein